MGARNDDAALQPLVPAGAARAAEQFVERLGLREAPPAGARPRTAAVMIATVDGRASVSGRSVALGHPADRALLRALRAGVDALLVGSRTLAAERYANLLDAGQRAARADAGLPEHPLLATISRGLDLPDVPVLGEQHVPVAIYTEAQAAPPAHAARAGIERFAAGTLTPAAVLEHLGAHHSARAVLCEGGPALLRELVAAGGIDDLLLTVSPLLAAGDAPAVLEGDALPAPARLELRDVHRAGDHVFLHYATAPA